LTLDQAAISALLVALLGVFALDRFRVEVVALAGLALGVALGLVPFGRTFSGLANPAVVTVIEILLIVQALERSRLLDALGDRLQGRLGGPRRILLVLCVLGAGVSTVMNNIGAFALVLPVAFSVTRRAGISPRAVVMPLSFATLLGGLCTLVGTPANLVVSEALRGARGSGSGFGFLDFAPTGFAVAALGVTAIVLWAPRALAEATPAANEAVSGRRIVTEATLLGAPASVGELSERLEGSIHAAVRGGSRLFPLRAATALEPGDTLLVDADEAAFGAAVQAGSLAAARSAGPGAELEAVVMPQSTLVGSRAATIPAFADGGLRLLAVATHNPRVEGSLDELQLGIGDILHLEGDRAALGELVEDSGLMPLAPMARREPGGVSPVAPVAFGLGILIAAFGLAPPEIAFGAVVLALAAWGALDLRAALAELNWPIVLLLAAMLPLGEAVATTGAAATIAGALTATLPAGSPVAAAALMLGLAMLITPFVNNATTAVILAPIAVELAQAEGVSPALVLMAVAIGASSDFLTPFGHHNNTLAYGLGGYSFRDFPRLGWPVSAVAFVTGVATCVLVWS
jgi:di/tricarboxylate transporter